MNPNYYAILTAEVRYDKELPPMAKLLYAEVTALTAMNGICKATNDHFAEVFGLTKSSISRLISQLVQKGYLHNVIRYKEGTKEIAERYLTPIRKNEYTLSPKMSIPYTQKWVYPILKNEEAIINLTDSINIPPYNPPKGEEEPVERIKAELDTPQSEAKPKTSKANFSFEAMKSFEAFWAVYPKQRAGNKQKALAAYIRVLREKRADLAGLQKAVELYAASDEVAKGFAKGCAAWLNNDRFNDEYRIDGMTPVEHESYEQAKEAEKARVAEESRQRREAEAQEKIEREKNRLMGDFFENKGYSRASLAVNNPKLYRELRSEFELMYGGVNGKIA